jgi:hypothetical protein
MKDNETSKMACRGKFVLEPGVAELALGFLGDAI